MLKGSLGGGSTWTGIPWGKALSQKKTVKRGGRRGANLDWYYRKKDTKKKRRSVIKANATGKTAGQKKRGPTRQMAQKIKQKKKE